ncbi:hypothetical protein [Cobetia crustatorum]|uniref:hypothetical protein n=1 Tax=Cobetia crustatorum TaxID=553385 RepID=UPI0012EB5320|nr:hypothetical protein [Cobetia crustatorum]
MPKSLGAHWWVANLPHLVFVASFTLLIFCEFNFDLYAPLVGSWVGEVLTLDMTARLISGISMSVVAAYIFYLFVELLPKLSARRETLMVLNRLLVSLLDTYNRTHVFGHELSIENIEVDNFDNRCLEQIKDNLSRGKSNKNDVDYGKLKFMVMTADSRLEDFRGVIGLAVSLSPSHALKWLVITDKVRLLAECYNKDPLDRRELGASDVTDETLLSWDADSLRGYFLEFVEEVINWRNIVAR